VFSRFFDLFSPKSLLQFLPVIGRIVADAIEGTLDPEIMQQFAVDRSKENPADWLNRQHGSTGPIDLATERLCTPEDLLP
jgi:sarcosine oxidase / L-pipecolate oxidase